MVWLQLRMSTKCRESTRAGTAKARANKCWAFEHCDKGPAQTVHALAGTRYLSTQAGWQTHIRRQGARMQVHSTRKQEGHAAQAPRPGEMRPTRIVEDGPKERSLGIKSRLVAENLELFEPDRRTTGFRASGCRTCRLVPSSIGYASQKLSREARTDAPERSATCPSTKQRGTAIRLRTFSGKPCQRPGPLLAPSEAAIPHNTQLLLESISFARVQVRH